MASELRELLQKIEQEHKAMQLGLTGLASVARHEFARRKYAAIDQEFVKVVDLVGTDKACDLVLDIFDKTPPPPNRVKRGYETAQIGDVLVYLLRPDQKPKNDRPWYGLVTHMLPAVRYLYTPIQNTHAMHFWIRCLDTAYLYGEELIRASQVIDVLSKEEFEQGVRDGTIELHT